MNVTFACPQCEQTAHASLAADTSRAPPTEETGNPYQTPSAGRIDNRSYVICPHCQAQIAMPRGAIDGGQLRRCVVCPSTDLYARKDFPQRLGVALVVLGFAASCVAWYYYAIYWTFAILFATALVDVVLYVVCGTALQCYRCGAIYRDVPGIDEHAPFSLDVHERHRQHAARETDHSALPAKVSR